MKKVLNISVALLILLSLGGCKKYLDEVNPSDVTTEFLYTTPAGLQSAVTGLYTIERGISTGSDAGNYFSEVMGDGGTDIDFNISADQEMAYYQTNIDLSTQGIVNAWWSMWYTMIERTNSIITYGRQVSMSDAARATTLREAYVYRAYAYFWLLRRYDNIWLDTIPTTSNNIAGRTYTVANQSDVYNQITSDLNMAIQYYGKDWSVVPGRFNQGVARLLRADVAMWQKDYQTAANQTDTIINSKTFALVDPSAVYTQDGRNSTSESMYVMQFDQFAIGGGAYHRMPLIFASQYRLVPGCVGAPNYGGYGWGRILPNEYMMSLYDKSYDKRYTNWWQSYYTYNNSAFNFSSTKYKLGDTLKYNDNSQLTSTNFFNNANVGCKKYWDPTQGPTITKHYNNIYIYRYPQVLLLAAEANMDLGNNTKALTQINQLRASRILATSPNQSLTTINQQVFLDEYARELAFEGQRWFLLKRLGLLVQRVQTYGGEPTFRGVAAPTPLYFSARTNIQSYHVRWPIPQAALNGMGGFPQNPGY